MSKFCCCADPELPNLSFSVTCVCCQSKVDEHIKKDSPDLTMDEVDGKEDDKQVICCFLTRRKRHAKVEREMRTSQ